VIADHLELRTLAETDLDQVLDLDEMVFNDPPQPDQVRAMAKDLFELDQGRGIGIFASDGHNDELAGVGAISGLEMAVPGGLLPLAGVLLIAVKPTYRRRGLMSRMIRHQLHTLHEEGLEPLAGLTASESVIYGRFGYGVATYSSSFAIPRHRSALRPVPGTDEVRVRLVPTAESVAACEAVHARQVGKRIGMLVRPERWGRLYGTDVEAWREGRSVLRTVLAERDGEAIGFARYHTKNETGPNGLATGYTDVSEIYADDAAGHAALAGYLLSLDLVGGTRFYRQPVDSPLVYLLEDMRAGEMRVRDALYLRLVDVDRALAGRTYAAPVNLVLEVSDRLCPWNAGRWHLTGDEKGATCTRTDDPADLALDVRELASVYLGGTTFAALAQAALVSEFRPGAVTDVSRAFATDLAPWLQFGI
jgi:predicted acetyltransferase